LTYFAPFLIILYYRKSLVASLWGSLACGLILDVLSSRTHLGFYALTFMLTSSILFHQRRNFFGDSLATMPLMVFFFSSLSYFIQALLFYIFEKQFAFSLQWIAGNLIALPACDALFAFTLFILPWRVIGKPPRKGSEYFMDRT
jgi:rod shape-determining protein MreD